MNDFEIQDEPIVKKKRPIFLLVLVILSSLNMSVSILWTFSGMVGSKPDAKMFKQAKLEFANMREQLEEGGAADFTYIIDQMESVTDNMFKHFQVYNTVQFLILVLGLTGVILMYQSRKLGFHLYIIYSIGLVVLPYLFNPITGIPTLLTIVGILYGGLWVLLYSRNLHWMEA